jgi:uncharacterized protein (DUF2147 family)
MKTAAFVSVIALGFAGGAFADPVSPIGRWMTASGNVEVAIQPCGRALCGLVSRVFANHSMQSSGPSKAPPAKVGLQVLSDVRSAGDGRWVGRVYNRERGQTFDCELSLAGPDALVVHPYIWLPIFGQTQIWRRSRD